MIGDMNNFVKFSNHNGGIVKVGNNVGCHIKGIWSITLDGKTNTNDFYRYFTQRSQTIVLCTNVKVDDNFGFK